MPERQRVLPEERSGEFRLSDFPPRAGKQLRAPSEVAARRELEQFRALVIRALRRVTSPKDPEYEDLIQSALAGVLAAISTREFAGQHYGQWVVSVARNITVDRLRARARERKLFEANDGEHEPSSVSAVGPEHLTHIRRELRDLGLALDRLGPRRAAVVYLHDVQGRDLEEIAEVIGISVAAAQSRLVRGRRDLLRSIAEGRKRIAG